jgi:hypothetical protein
MYLRRRECLSGRGGKHSVSERCHRRDRRVRCVRRSLGRASGRGGQTLLDPDRGCSGRALRAQSGAVQAGAFGGVHRRAAAQRHRQASQADAEPDLRPVIAPATPNRNPPVNPDAPASPASLLARDPRPHAALDILILIASITKVNAQMEHYGGETRCPQPRCCNAPPRSTTGSRR